MQILFLPALWLSAMLASTTLTAAETDPDAWPREIRDGDATLLVHHPVIDRWPDYAAVEGWIPVEVRSGTDGEAWIGAVRARAETTLDLERRLVTLDGQEVLDVRFSDPDTPPDVLALARRAVNSESKVVALDEVLAALADDFQPPGASDSDPGFQRQPPRIVVSRTPLQLLLIDQEPVRAPIEGTRLEVVVNTDWDLFHDTAGRRWYVINQGVWQSQSLLASGGWTTTTELPADFRSLAVGERWAGVQAALPPRAVSEPPVPFLISLEPTELVVLDGEPRLQAIPGAGGLAVVANTERDLFRLGERWYFLAAGRWFSSGDLDGEWSAVDDLPGAFAAIPPDHGRAHVRRSVPGTVESAIAYIEATLPQSNVVSLQGQPDQPVVYVGEPRFEPIAGTQLERAVNTPFAVIRHNNFHYLALDAAWYSSAEPRGPWRVATRVPDEIFRIPPSDPLYYVTYLRPAGNAEAGGEARFSYSEGYNGMYTIGRRAVRGTGYRYSPWIGYPPSGPVYWGYPYTYGGWGRYGPHGYWGPSAYWMGYTPLQQLEIDGPVRGVGGQAAPSEQDPDKARRGYDYTTLDQQRSAAPADRQRAAQDLYAGPDGTVYRRGDEGWSRHDSGEWDTMAELQRQYGVEAPRTGAPTGQQRQAYRQNPEDIERMERYYERRAKSYNLYSEVWVRR